MQLLENALDSRITVVCADTGGKGITLCRTFKPHCVLLQVHLPDMTALEFLSALRTGIKASPVAVVVIADDDDEGIAMEAQKWGAQDYVLESTLTAGQLQRAIKDFDEAIRLNPKYAKAYGHRGYAYGNLGQHERAIEDLDEAIRLDPQFAIAYNNRGKAYEALGNQAQADADYAKWRSSPKYKELVGE